MYRIVIVGATSSGKTTLAKTLADMLGLRHIELDALYWKPNWKPASHEEVLRVLEQILPVSGWVADGNYSFCRDLLWGKADTVIWLDYPFFTIFQRLWKRTWKRWWEKEVLWGTNTEPLFKHFMLWSDESLIKWLFKTYHKRKRTYQQIIQDDLYPHISYLHFTTPQETEQWLLSVVKSR